MNTECFNQCSYIGDGGAGVLVLWSSNVHWWWWWCARALQGFKPDPE